MAKHHVKPNQPLVPCPSCNYMSDYERLNRLCTHCNNSKLIPDPKTVLCNLCGECMCPIGTINESYPHGLYAAQVSGGYHSYHLIDCCNYTFSFCEKCLRKLFNECKIKPRINDSGDEVSFEEDQATYDYKVWRDAGGPHQAYLNQKCNAVKDCPNDAIYSFFSDKEFTEKCSCEEHKKNYGIYFEIKPFICNEARIFL